MADKTAQGVTVVALTHDLVRRLSLVSLKWTDGSQKKVSLPVPFGCGLGDVRREAERALRALSAETATLIVLDSEKA